MPADAPGGQQGCFSADLDDGPVSWDELSCAIGLLTHPELCRDVPRAAADRGLAVARQLLGSSSKGNGPSCGPSKGNAARSRPAAADRERRELELHGRPAAIGYIPGYTGDRIRRDRCGATRRDAEPCQAPAIPEGLVCRTHCGSAPQVQIAAEHHQLLMTAYTAADERQCELG